MSSTVSSSATTPKSLKKVIGQLVGFVLLGTFVLLGLIFYVEPWVHPPLEAGLRKTKAGAESFVSTRANEIDEDYFSDRSRYEYTKDGKTRTNPGNWFRTAWGGATEVRDDRRMAAAVIARANDRDETIPQAEVLGTQGTWVTFAEIRVPTRITVPITDEITPHFRPKEKSNADGIPFDPEKHRYDRTVLMQERFEAGLPMENVGDLNELIGKFCVAPGNCRAGFPQGTDAVLCVGPGFRDGGYYKARWNGLEVIDRVRTKMDFHAVSREDPGKFRLTIKPDNPDKGELESTRICNEHPGALVIKKPQPATEVILVSD